MLKKLLILAALLILATPLVQAETYILVGGQLVLSAGDTRGIGGGWVTGVGYRVSDYMILWGNFEGSKTNEGDKFNKWLAGTSLQSPYVIPKIRSGIYGLFEGGGGKIGDDDLKFSGLVNLGFYSLLDKKTSMTAWLGGGYSTVEKVNTYSVQVGLSWALK